MDSLSKKALKHNSKKFQLECVFKKTGAAVCLFLLFTDLLPCVPAVLWFVRWHAGRGVFLVYCVCKHTHKRALRTAKGSHELLYKVLLCPWTCRLYLSLLWHPTPPHPQHTHTHSHTFQVKPSVFYWYNTISQLTSLPLETAQYV